MGRGGRGGRSGGRSGGGRAGGGARGHVGHHHHGGGIAAHAGHHHHHHPGAPLAMGPLIGHHHHHHPAPIIHHHRRVGGGGGARVYMLPESVPTGIGSLTMAGTDSACGCPGGGGSIRVLEQQVPAQFFGLYTPEEWGRWVKSLDKLYAETHWPACPCLLTLLFGCIGMAVYRTRRLDGQAALIRAENLRLAQGGPNGSNQGLEWVYTPGRAPATLTLRWVPGVREAFEGLNPQVRQVSREPPPLQFAMGMPLQQPQMFVAGGPQAIAMVPMQQQQPPPQQQMMMMPMQQPQQMQGQQPQMMQMQPQGQMQPQMQMMPMQPQQGQMQMQQPQMMQMQQQPPQQQQYAQPMMQQQQQPPPQYQPAYAAAPMYGSGAPVQQTMQDGGAVYQQQQTSPPPVMNFTVQSGAAQR